MKIKIKDKKCMPTKAHDTDAGFDLRSTEEITLVQGQYYTIDTGLAIELPKTHFGLILPRSGIGSKGFALRNTAAVIDPGYIGNILLKVENKGSEYIPIKMYERIAQLIIIPFLPVELEVVDFIGSTERGEKGFGDSGTH